MTSMQPSRAADPTAVATAVRSRPEVTRSMRFAAGGGAAKESFDPGPVDCARVELNEDHELRYWTQAFDCTANELLEALACVGVNAQAVEAHLRSRR